MVARNKKVTHDVKPCATTESKASTWRDEVRGDSLQSAKSSSLQEEGALADCSEADRDAMESREDFWNMSGELISRHHVMLPEQLYVPKESSFSTPLK